MAGMEFEYILDVKGNVVKREKDCREEVETKINIVRDLIRDEKFDDSFDILMGLEKITRNAADLESYVIVIDVLLEIFVKFELWAQLNELIISLSRKRGQFKHAVVEIVQKSVNYLGGIADEEIRHTLAKTLCQIGENKIYVENERARLLLMLSKSEELTGNKKEALDLIKDLHVDSYCDMPIHEKNEIMIEQLRLCIDNKDLVRAQIVSSRIHPNTIDDAEHPELKLKYYKVMMNLRYTEENYLELCQIGLSAIKLAIVSSDSSVLYPLFSMTIISLLLSPFDEKRRDLSQRILAHRNINEMKFLKEILTLFDKKELISFQAIKGSYWEHLNECVSKNYFEYVSSFEESQQMLKIFQNRVIEHNLTVIYKCYSQINLSRAAELLDCSEEEAESAICSSVSSKVIFARINRPKWTVVFKPILDSSEILNNYSSRLTSLLLDVGYTATLINKEYNQAEISSA